MEEEDDRYGILRDMGMSPTDMLFIPEDVEAFLDVMLEEKKGKRLERVVGLIKRYSKLNKKLSGITAMFSAFDSSTDAMQWILERYSTYAMTGHEGEVAKELVEAYYRIKIWSGYFMSLVNSLNFALWTRRYTTAEKIITKMEKEVERAVDLYREFDRKVRELIEIQLGPAAEVELPEYLR